MRASKLFIIFIAATLNLQFMAMFSYHPVLAQEVANAGFCSKIESASNENVAKLSKGRMMGKRHDMYFDSIETKRDKLRGDYDKKRSEHIGSINKQHNSPEQREAITRFRQTIESATELRRTTIDSIRAEFRSKLNELSIEHRNQVDALEAELIQQVSSAYSTAKQSCANGEDPAQVKQQFMSSLEQAKSNFSQSKADLSDDSELNSAIAERDDRIKQAIDAFKLSLEQAKADLQQALNPN